MCFSVVLSETLQKKGRGWWTRNYSTDVSIYSVQFSMYFDQRQIQNERVPNSEHDKSCDHDKTISYRNARVCAKRKHLSRLASVTISDDGTMNLEFAPSHTNVHVQMCAHILD